MFNPGGFQQGLQSTLSLGGAPPASAPGGIGGLQGFGQSGGFGSIASLLGNLFGDSDKGFEDFENQIQQGIGGLRGGLQQGLGFLSPFQQAGGTAVQRELGLLGQQSDPAQFISQILGKFQQSPAQKAGIQSGLEAVQNRLGAQGLGQSGAEQKALEQFAQQQTAGQQEQFLKDALGLRQNTLSGLGQLGGFGLGAAQTGAQATAQEATNEAALKAQLGKLQQQQQASSGQGLSNILGDAGSIAGLLAFL